MKVSIIVPCFDVDPYVDECLRSAVGQSHHDLEVIAIDDGSTDATGRLLDAWAETDERVRVVHQANSGLGAARNVGSDLATGDALFFLDGDDFLDPDAISRLVESASESSSEIVAGVIEVWCDGETWRATQQRSLYDTDHRRASLHDLPELVYDPMACSKLFRRTLWDRLGLRFREGVRFEDVDLVVHALGSADGIDIVADTTYFWRRRTVGVASITQTVDARAIADRFDALRRAHAHVVASGDDRVIATHVQKLVELDVRRAVRQATAAGPEEMAAVVDAAKPLIEAVSRHELDAVAPMMRAVCLLILEGDTRGLESAERCFAAPGRSPFARAVAGVGLLVRRPFVAAELGRAVIRRIVGSWSTRFRA